MIFKKDYQKGSIISFVVVSALLGLIIFGSIYFLKKHGEQVRHDQIIASINKNKSSESVKKEDSNTKSVSDFNNNSTTLPETGAELDVFRLLGVCLLTISIFKYLDSRRNLQAGRL